MYVTKFPFYRQYGRIYDEEEEEEEEQGVEGEGVEDKTAESTEKVEETTEPENYVVCYNSHFFFIFLTFHFQKRLYVLIIMYPLIT